MYLTYAEYQSMGGAITETSFNALEMKAESVVDWHTLSRLKNDTVYPQCLKKCMFELIELVETKAKALMLEEGGVIKSQSNDGVSTSYNTLSSADAVRICDEQGRMIVESWLYGERNQSGVDLLYRGVE